MFNKKNDLSKKSSLLRPGLVTGVYPEKKHISRGLLENVWHHTLGYLRSDRARSHKYTNILSAIHKQCQALETLDDASFKEEVISIRRRMHRDGLTSDLTTQAFALVREAAWRALGMRHYDCQLIGGWIMVHGGLAEMETGEGKSLTATLAAGAAALAGIPVHIITVNDYLVERDSSLMEPLYTLLGVTVAGVTATMDASVRRTGYLADIVYCSNKQLAFDYLRDRMLLSSDQHKRRLKLDKLSGRQSRADHLFLRGLCFGIVDEADSVLIDEAGTPLVISKESDSTQENETYYEVFKMAQLLEKDAHFSVDYQNRCITPHDTFSDRVTVLRQKQEGLKLGRLQTEELVVKALSALCLYRLDKHYLVQGNKVVIIDENTGRLMADRSWERGLHQFIEIKEGCELSGQREHIARLTYQRFFSRYLCLAGMSGTASEVRHEIWNVYSLPTEKVITNKKSVRCDEGQNFYPTKAAKWAGIVKRIEEKNSIGQPVLVGTRSVADSEHLGALLTKHGVKHQILNARQDSKEAEIVAEAGSFGKVTVATNMAGRGTDIPLGDGAAHVGGLHVICTELNDAKRIDRQLYGRCGRQGEPGSYETFISFEDELFLSYLGVGKETLFKMVLCLSSHCTTMFGPFLARQAQKRVERKNRVRRVELLQREEQFSKALAFSGSME
ncbi:preprotein translocase subunit SecA [Desulforhopalus sp. 52FAK]